VRKTKKRKKRGCRNASGMNVAVIHERERVCLGRTLIEKQRDSGRVKEMKICLCVAMSQTKKAASRMEMKRKKMKMKMKRKEKTSFDCLNQTIDGGDVDDVDVDVVAVVVVGESDAADVVVEEENEKEILRVEIGSST